MVGTSQSVVRRASHRQLGSLHWPSRPFCGPDGAEEPSLSTPEDGRSDITPRHHLEKCSSSGLPSGCTKLGHWVGPLVADQSSRLTLGCKGYLASSKGAVLLRCGARPVGRGSAARDDSAGLPARTRDGLDVSCTQCPP